MNCLILFWVSLCSFTSILQKVKMHKICQARWMENRKSMIPIPSPVSYFWHHINCVRRILYMRSFKKRKKEKKDYNLESDLHITSFSLISPSLSLSLSLKNFLISLSLSLKNFLISLYVCMSEEHLNANT